jgi:hypothetical protein
MMAYRLNWWGVSGTRCEDGAGISASGDSPMARASFGACWLPESYPSTHGVLEADGADRPRNECLRR